MNRIILLFLLAALPAILILPAQEKKLPARPPQVAELVVPSKLVFPAKTGRVIYDHAAHAKREKNDCKVCHDALWPQNAKEPLNFKSAMHKAAEDKKTSCGFCHRPEGKAFAAKGNCTTKCHVRAAAKKE